MSKPKSVSRRKITARLWLPGRHSAREISKSDESCHSSLVRKSATNRSSPTNPFFGREKARSPADIPKDSDTPSQSFVLKNSLLIRPNAYAFPFSQIVGTTAVSDKVTTCCGETGFCRELTDAL